MTLRKPEKLFLSGCWIVAIAWLLFVLFYILRHDAYFYSDLLWHYESSLNLLHGWSHQDYQEMVVPAYLVNLPFIALGFGFYGLKVACFFLEIIAFCCFLWAYDSRVFKTYLLPLCLILFSAIYSMILQAIFNYYSVPAIFLLFALAAYLQSLKGYRPYLFSVLAALALVVVACSSCALLPITTLAILCLLLIRRTRYESVLFVVYLVCTGLLLWLYLSVLGEKALYAQAFLGTHIHGESQVYLVFCISNLCMVLLGLLLPYLFHDCFPACCRVALLVTCFCVSFLAFDYWLFYTQQHANHSVLLRYPNLFFAVSSVFSLFLLCYQRLSKEKLRQLFLVAFVLIFIMALNRGTSLSKDILMLYFPSLLSVMLVTVSSVWKSPWKPVVFSLLVLTFMISPIFLMLYFNQSRGHFVSISINQNTFHGLPENNNVMNVQKKLLATYKYYDCGKKPFLAIYDYVSAYILTKRLPMFHRSFVPFADFEWKSKAIENRPLIAYFSKLKHWCVAWKTTPWNLDGVRRQHIFKRWLINHSTHHISIGVLPYRHEFVWLYVK